MPLAEFSRATLESVKSYVYALADERDRIFYIGKGTGNRVFAHVDEVRPLLLSDPTGLLASPDSEQDEDIELPTPMGPKRHRIAEMLRAKQEPRKYIVVEGLDDTAALMVESVLISVMDWQLDGALTNMVSGHRTAEFGLKTVEELEATRGEPFDLGELARRGASTEGGVIAININRRWSEASQSPARLLEVSSGDWKVSEARASRCRYAVVHANGVVRGVFEIDHWVPAGAGRMAFVAVGEAALEGDAFRNKNASTLFGPAGRGSQNPIRYVPFPALPPKADRQA